MSKDDPVGALARAAAALLQTIGGAGQAAHNNSFSYYYTRPGVTLDQIGNLPQQLADALVAYTAATPASSKQEKEIFTVRAGAVGEMFFECPFCSSTVFLDVGFDSYVNCHSCGRFRVVRIHH